MLCNKCGIEMGNEAFCPNCGTPAGQGAPAGAEAAPSVDIKKYLPIIGAVAGVLVIVILLVSLLGGGGSGKIEKLLNKQAKAIMNEDTDAYVKTLPECVLKQFKDAYGSTKDFEDAVDEELATLNENFEDEYDKGYKVSYNVIDTRKMSEDELEDLTDLYEKTIDEEVTKGYKAAVEVTIKGDDGKEYYYTSASIIKIDGEWYLTSDSVMGNVAYASSSDWDDYEW